MGSCSNLRNEVVVVVMVVGVGSAGIANFILGGVGLGGMCIHTKMQLLKFESI
jgi:hypothetical protein